MPIILWAERKLLGRFQSRIGPNRVGPKGLMQPLADVLKLLSKEQSTPATAVPWMMAIAPVISIVTAVATLAIIPFGPAGRLGRRASASTGSTSRSGCSTSSPSARSAFYGLVLGGWASGSKYSFLGAMRSAAQLISYEVALGLSLLGVVMTAGSLSVVDIVEAQGDIWYVIPQFVGFCIFLVAGFAETARAPFDLPEADAEIVGRLQHRVRRDALRLVLHGRVHRGRDHLRHRGRLLPRRLARARAGGARVRSGCC